MQAHVLELFKDLQEQYGFACLFISHDLAVVEILAKQIAVLHRGKLAEIGSRERILRNPQDPYTKRLLAAAPGARIRPSRASGARSGAPCWPPVPITTRRCRSTRANGTRRHRRRSGRGHRRGGREPAAHASDAASTAADQAHRQATTRTPVAQPYLDHRRRTPAGRVDRRPRCSACHRRRIATAAAPASLRSPALDGISSTGPGPGSAPCAPRP